MELGVYREFADVRKVALELAIDSAKEFNAASLSPDAVLSRAESYFLFLINDL